MNKTLKFSDAVVFVMRVTLLQLLLTTSLLTYTFAGGLHGQEILEKKVSISVSGEEIKSVLRKISSVAEVGFTYASTILPDAKKITLTANGERLGDILTRLLTPLNINFEVINNHIVLRKSEILISALSSVESNEALAKIITGTVTSADGVPLQGVSINISGTTKGEVTDAKGQFQIEANEGDVLIFSSVGFTEVRVTVGVSSTINVVMKEGQNSMREVVVTALGIKREKRSLGYSSEAIGGNEVARSNAPNVINALSGKMAGVNVTTPNGVDGGSTRIIIGGNNTISGDNQPLIIIDGMPMDNTIPAAAQDVTAPKDWGSAINLINPQDIEDINILKGPAAAAAYGGRGANGVILITTKKGTKREGLGVDYNLGYKTADPYRFVKMQNEYGAGGMVSLNAPQYNTDADGNPVLTDGWEGLFVDPKTGTGPYGIDTWNQVSWPGSGVSWGHKMDGTIIKWWDGTMKADVPQPDNLQSYYRNGNQFTNNVAVSGGNEWGTIRASYTNLNNTAIIPNSNYRQNSR